MTVLVDSPPGAAGNLAEMNLSIPAPFSRLISGTKETRVAISSDALCVSTKLTKVNTEVVTAADFQEASISLMTFTDIDCDIFRFDRFLTVRAYGGMGE